MWEEEEQSSTYLSHFLGAFAWIKEKVEIILNFTTFITKFKVNNKRDLVYYLHYEKSTTYKYGFVDGTSVPGETYYRRWDGIWI